MCQEEGKPGEAKTHFKTAAKLIEETGYHRRDKEILTAKGREEKKKRGSE